MSRNQLTLGSLFDGIGGWLASATDYGIKPLWSSEIEKFPLAVTHQRFPDVEQIGDIRNLDGGAIHPVDIICMGSPCQNLSMAGKREGLKGEQSGLFREATRIIREMRRATGGKYPRFVVWENVPGAFSSNKGMDFRAVLQEIGQAEIPMPLNGKWANAGVAELPQCEIAWRVLDAQYWGVPQRRRRIFLVADFAADGRCAAEILFEPESVSGNTSAGESQGEGAAERTERSLGATGEDVKSKCFNICSYASNSMKSENPHSGIYETDKTRTLDLNGGNPACNQGGTMIVSAGFKGGQSAKASLGYAVETSACLASQSSGTEPTVAVYDMTHANEVMRPVKDGIAPTLNARMGTGGNQVPVVRHAVYSKTSFAKYEEAANTTPLRASGGDIGGGSENLCCQSFVRRLTPTECERLQGLPDGYTLIEDKSCSDSARYKALGNGMAKPCSDYVLRRLAKVTQEGESDGKAHIIFRQQQLFQRESL